jgi:small subunit ribosomal protein S21
VVEVRLKKGESVDKALRRLKKKLDREGVLREARTRRCHEKPSVKKRRKAKEPKINYWGSFSL